MKQAGVDEELLINLNDSGNSTHVKHAISYELQTTGKIANMLSGSQVDNKIKERLEQAAKTVKQQLQSGQD